MAELTSAYLIQKRLELVARREELVAALNSLVGAIQVLDMLLNETAEPPAERVEGGEV